MSIFTFTLNVLNTNAEDAKMAPEMQTARHPNLLHNPDTTGPNLYMNGLIRFVAILKKN